MIAPESELYDFPERLSQREGFRAACPHRGDEFFQSDGRKK